MKHFTKSFSWAMVLCVALILTIIIFPFGCSKKQPESKEIKIGVILPLTGDAAIYGKAMKNGIDLAYREYKSKNLIQIQYEDDMGENKSAASAGHKLINSSVDAIIGGAMSSTAEVLIPLAKTNRIPLVSPGASSPAFDKISKYFFRLWPSDTYDGKIMADLITTKMNLSDIAVFYTRSQYGEGIRAVFEDAARKANAKICFSESFEEGNRDFRTQLLKIKNSGAKALFIPGYYSEVSVIMKQIKELNVDIRIFGTSSFHDQKLLDELGTIMDGVVFSFPEFDPNANNTVKDFSSKYFATFNTEADVWAALSYDCFNVIAEVVDNGAKSAADIQAGLFAIKSYDGASGMFSFDEDGNVIKQLVIFTVRDGQFLKLNME